MFDNVMLQITWRMAHLPLDLKTIKDTIINIIGSCIHPPTIDFFS